MDPTTDQISPVRYLLTLLLLFSSLITLRIVSSPYIYFTLIHRIMNRISVSFEKKFIDFSYPLRCDTRPLTSTRDLKPQTLILVRRPVESDIGNSGECESSQTTGSRTPLKTYNGLLFILSVLPHII